MKQIIFRPIPGKGLALLLALFLVFLMAPAPGGTILNGTSTGMTSAKGFLFEPEVPFATLKAVPTWNELEQLLDNPYSVRLCSSLPVAVPALIRGTPGNDAGFPSYCTTSAFQRRPGFSTPGATLTNPGPALPPLLVHPLNYNTTTGEEMRLINRDYVGGDFNVVDQLVQCTVPGVPAGCPAVADPNRYVWTYKSVYIIPGADRVEPGSIPIDYNNPIPADTYVCVTVLEQNPPEGSILCGGDPGEPGYIGFGRPTSPTAPNHYAAYSTPAIVIPTSTGTTGVFSPGMPVPPAARLYDPERGLIQPRNATTGAGGLRKPSLRLPEVGGTPSSPNFLLNTDPNEVTHSTENDYVRNRNMAIVLGKSLFWDMQVGSDGVQSCGTCHFTGAGTDTRTKNQINPNHLGGDLTFSLMQPNQRDLVLADFPLHKLTNPEIAGDPAATTPLTASVNAGVLENNFPGGVSGFVVADANNIVSDTNDVVSSMGVVYSHFTDIAPIGTFQPAANGVAAVMPDLRIVGDPDPIPGFQGMRRVEPRNTPTMHAAAFNFDNFWDGRARHDFNGGSVFGAADPQNHVFVNSGGTLVPTRQIIRFTSLASLATGPGLSEFEMSFQGRNWAKIGKKLLQAGVTPLANQLVDPTDSVLGRYSNQGGAACASLPAAQKSAGGMTLAALGKPGLCISYPAMIQIAYYPALWGNTVMHLNGSTTAPPPGTPGADDPIGIPILNSVGAVVDLTADPDPAKRTDPFDGYSLTAAAGAANPADTSQFTQMEGNFSLFWGLGVNLWVTVLVPDDTPFDQLLDVNPDAFMALGEPGEPGLVPDLLNCTSGTERGCFREHGNFKRDPGVLALQNPTGEGGEGGIYVPAGGTRVPSASTPDPLLGLDIFFASNLSLKNPNFRTGRCGECHAIPTLTDHTMAFTSKINLMDAVNEFATPGVELIVEPLARLRVISGFLLESEINENGQDAVERRILNQSLVPNPVDGLAYPSATAAGLPGFGPWTGADSAFFDNGMYNLGIRPTGDDIGRGGPDAFGWPLSLATLMMKNLAGPGFEPGVEMTTFDENLGITGGLFEVTAQDQQINPGFEGEPGNPLLPPYLGEFSNNITVGDFPPEMDEAGGAIGGMVNTLTDVAMIEGFADTLGPFNPGNISAEVMNFGGLSSRPGDTNAMMGTWPNVNRVVRNGAFKAAPLRNVELTGPYFHNGGKATLRQVVDFYVRGGDFPLTNAAHRDFNLVNMNIEVQSNLTEDEKVALVDFLLELTDERVAYDKGPFDHPQVIIPVDGTAPDNTLGRSALLADPRFRDIPAVGTNGFPTREPTFLNITRQRLVGGDAFTVQNSHYSH